MAQIAAVFKYFYFTNNSLDFMKWHQKKANRGSTNWQVVLIELVDNIGRKFCPTLLQRTSNTQPVTCDYISIARMNYTENCNLTVKRFRRYLIVITVRNSRCLFYQKRKSQLNISNCNISYSTKCLILPVCGQPDHHTDCDVDRECVVQDSHPCLFSLRWTQFHFN